MLCSRSSSGQALSILPPAPEHHEWNVINQDPKKDPIRIWKDTTHKAGLRFGVTPTSPAPTADSDTKGKKKGVPYDGAPFNAPKEGRDHWAKRVKQLIDDYQPEASRAKANPLKKTKKSTLIAIPHIKNKAASALQQLAAFFIKSTYLE